MISNSCPFSAVGVNDQAISLLWSTKAAGTVVACLSTGPAFGTNFMNPSNRKLIVLGSTLFVVAICLVVAPFLTNYLLLMSRKYLFMSPKNTITLEITVSFQFMVSCVLDQVHLI